MRTIDNDNLASVRGGISAHRYCVNAVAGKAHEWAGRDDRLQLGEARKLIGSVQHRNSPKGNELHACERAGLRRAMREQSMTGPARDKISDFISAAE